jgi:hypothetical protein
MATTSAMAATTKAGDGRKRLNMCTAPPIDR